MKYQHLFNEQLRNSVTTDQGLSTQLKKVLHLSKESIYRRLRNETAYTLEELAALAKHFKISLDNVIMEKDSQVINMFCDTIFHESGVISSYLDRLSDKLNHLAREDGQLVVVASDLPVHHALSVPELRNFISYYWQKVILNRSRLKGIPYNNAFYQGDLNQSIERMLDLMQRVSKIEIWTEETIDMTVRQIVYCDESGLFETAQDKERVILAVLELLNNLESQLELMTFGGKVGYKFFISSIELPNNFMLFRHNDLNEAFLNFSLFNTISTSNPAFCKEIDMLVETIIRKSVNIAGQSDIHRHRYFENLRKKLYDLLKQ